MSILTNNSKTNSEAGEQKQRRQLGRPSRGGSGRLPTTTRSWGAITAGVLVIIVAALLGALAFAQAGDTSSVLAVRDEVAKGQTIERDNLISKQVAGVGGAIAVDDVDAVVGKTAAVDLTAGQVVTDATVTEEAVPGTGRAVVGLAVTPSQMPGEGLGPGDLVRVVAVPAADDAAANLDDAPILAPSVEVLAVTRGKSGEAARVVTVIASDSDAGKLATASAAGRLAVIKISAPGAG